ncbi:MAG: nucleotide sugar dehydrogenase [Oscillospiraceae bacterium]|nr:nucleotide sugar dehydrogenase [Oscillospiraceae bacterium]
MVTYSDISSGKTKISIIGLGYVGLPISIAFARKTSVIGFDIDSAKIDTYRSGVDPTGEVGDEELRKSTMRFTADPTELKKALFHIVAVPTPVRGDKTPDLGPLEGACETLGANLTGGSVVVFESTVYPGVTEDICVPILERASGFRCGADFHVGYSPERINPGDTVHRLENIVKVVSGMDDKTLDLTAKVYELVVEVGVYRAPTIKVAEAAKVIENSQRDLNIAFMNELSLIFNRMDIDTLEVLKAAGTKWNFLKFQPGLVGGHCIGVDPYYLTYKAQQEGYHPQVILAGRRINDDMGRYIAENAIKQLILMGKEVCRSKFAVLGFTFKEDCPDTRNTRVIDVVRELESYGLNPLIADPVADAAEACEHYGVSLVAQEEIDGADCLIVAVAHKVFTGIRLEKFLSPGGLLVDVKGLFDPNVVKQAGYRYWRL